jgi:hypothetical protein
MKQNRSKVASIDLPFEYKPSIAISLLMLEKNMGLNSMSAPSRDVIRFPQTYSSNHGAWLLAIAR